MTAIYKQVEDPLLHKSLQVWAGSRETQWLAKQGQALIARCRYNVERKDTEYVSGYVDGINELMKCIGIDIDEHPANPQKI